MIRGRVSADQNGRPAPAPVGTGLLSASGTAPLVLTLTGASLVGSIDVSALPTRVKVKKAGSTIGTRNALNLIEGSGVAITAADDGVSDEVDVTIAVADGDRGDITVSGSGGAWTIDNGVVSTAKMGVDVTAAGKALLDDASAADQRATLSAVGAAAPFAGGKLLASAAGDLADESYVSYAVTGAGDALVALEPGGDAFVEVNGQTTMGTAGNASVSVRSGVGGSSASIELASEECGVILKSFGGVFPLSLSRWSVAKTASAGETGSNAGSDLKISRFADDGSPLGAAISINRATGVVTLGAALPVASGGTGAVGLTESYLPVMGAAGLEDSRIVQTAVDVIQIRARETAPDNYGGLSVSNTGGRTAIDAIHGVGMMDSSPSLAVGAADLSGGCSLLLHDGDTTAVLTTSGLIGTGSVVAGVATAEVRADALVDGVARVTLSTSGDTEPPTTVTVDTDGVSIVTGGDLVVGPGAAAAKLHVVQEAAEPMAIIEKYGGGAYLLCRRANGTYAAPTAVLTGENLAALTTNAHDGVAFAGNAGGLTVAAAENWSGTGHGTALLFTVCPIGTTTPVAGLRVENDGSLTLLSGAKVFSGTGSPEGVVTAPVGSLYLQTDGGTGTTLYIKESGVGNTGWAAPSGGAGAALTVEENDGSPSVASVTTIRFEGATVEEVSAGIVKVTVAASASGPAAPLLLHSSYGGF